MLPSHKLEQGNLSFHFSMHAFQTLTRNFDIQFIKRGIHTAGPTSLETSDGFGLVETNQELQNQEYLTVFPEILPLSALKLSSDHPFGTKKAIHRLFEDPQQTMGVREYHPQDGFRRIHWPATARSGELQVRVYEPVTAPVMTIAMNIATTEQPWLSDIPAMIENLVKVSASLAWYAIEEGYSVGLVSNGCLAHSDHPFSVSPGRSPDQLGILLQTLSATTSFFAGSFENMLVRKSVSLPMSSTLILVTAILQPELVETIYNLKRHSFKVLLFSLTEKPFPAIPGVTSFDLSGTL
jgi:uncharacterized protein (DUF58 family)